MLTYEEKSQKRNGFFRDLRKAKFTAKQNERILFGYDIARNTIAFDESDYPENTVISANLPNVGNWAWRLDEYRSKLWKYVTEENQRLNVRVMPVYTNAKSLIDILEIADDWEITVTDILPIRGTDWTMIGLILDAKEDIMQKPIVMR